MIKDSDNNVVFIIEKKITAAVLITIAIKI